MDYQSGKTQAIDLDELNVTTSNRPKEAKGQGRIELDNWGGEDPWKFTTEGRQRRRWAEDDRWLGDDDKEFVQSGPKADDLQLWKMEDDGGQRGWNAPKRGDVLEAGDGWEDWGRVDGPFKIDMDSEGKEFGGYRRVQAASQYEAEDDSVYADGKQRREDIYRRKESSSYGVGEGYDNQADPSAASWGTANLQERRGDPYASNLSNVAAPGGAGSEIPEMMPLSDWDFPTSAQLTELPDRPKALNDGEEPQTKGKDVYTDSISELPANTKASLIIFLPDGQKTVIELRQQRTEIGRALENAIVLNDPYASRKHLAISYTGANFELTALNRENLTSVNGYPVSRIILMHQDVIELGSTRMKFVFGAASQAHVFPPDVVNAEPRHLDSPPDIALPSGNSNKNLIIMVAVASVLVISLIVGILFVLLSGEDDESLMQAQQIETEESLQPAVNAAAVEIKVGLSDEDMQIADAMSELTASTTGKRYNGASSTYRGSDIKVLVKTTPEGAQIFNGDNTLRGTTPYEAKDDLLEDQEQMWTLKKEGYKDMIVTVNMGADIDLNLKLQSEEVAPPPKPVARPSAPKKPAARKPAAKKPAARKPARGRVIL
ncbi:MAG: FHA domain-containing protein [Bradymonadia bacterium]|jgi:pSer/pThr/pTyr-binding forkhead associated (FHA) protein